MEKEYPLHSRYELNSLYDSDRRTFIYDIGKYDKVLIVTNSPELKESQETLINVVWMQNKDITGLVEPQPAKVREKLIQSGKHYSEMLPVEYVPTDQYM